MALATITFKVKKPKVYEEYLKILEEVKLGKREREEFHDMYFDWLEKYQLTVLSNQRINSTNRFTSLVGFKDLNLFVEAMMYYREYLNNPEILGDPEPKFHIIDPDYKQFESNVPELLDMLERALVELASLAEDGPAIREILWAEKKSNGINRLKKFVEKRDQSVPSVISYINNALHMLPLSGEKKQILN